MSLQPDDPAADAFERLRTEVAMLRRAVEGLAACACEAAVDYSPTLAELSAAIAAVDAKTSALVERPLLALAPAQLGLIVQTAAAKGLTRPLTDLAGERLALRQAIDRLNAARPGGFLKDRSRQMTVGLLAGGAVAGAVLWSVLAGPLARSLPNAWGVPERLAAATLDLPMGEAAERMLHRGDPRGWQAVQIARDLPPGQFDQLRDCLSRAAPARRGICTVKAPRQ